MRVPSQVVRADRGEDEVAVVELELAVGMEREPLRKRRQLPDPLDLHRAGEADPLHLIHVILRDVDQTRGRDGLPQHHRTRVVVRHQQSKRRRHREGEGELLELEEALDLYPSCLLLLHLVLCILELVNGREPCGCSRER